MGFFAIRGRPSPAGMRSLRSGSVSGFRDGLDAAVRQLGGRVVSLFFLASDLSVLIILDLAPKGATALMIEWIASDSFEPGLTMERIETAAELDLAIAPAT